jgi:hypothetical protein
VDASQEFIKSFNFLMDEDEKDHNRSVPIIVYRRTQPPAFLRFPGGHQRTSTIAIFICFTGKNTIVPGFETLCTVSADLQDVFFDTTRSTANDGTRYRRVKVSLKLVRLVRR